MIAPMHNSTNSTSDNYHYNEIIYRYVIIRKRYDNSTSGGTITSTLHNNTEDDSTASDHTWLNGAIENTFKCFTPKKEKLPPLANYYEPDDFVKNYYKHKMNKPSLFTPYKFRRKEILRKHQRDFPAIRAEQRRLKIESIRKEN